ncbi:MAG TPA: cyclic nucleotide-binding domain-containing protein [Gammaproteobacteria bacterium]|nr:cyclic nucleotide-binding domain-containing protein [Gammaproteobacteria bacterium]
MPMAITKVFKFLTDDEYQALLQASERKIYKPGDVLIQEGQPQTNLYVIVKGEVKVQRDHGEGFSIEIARHGPGEIFGDMSFIEGQDASAGVVAAEEEVLAFVVTHDHIHRLAQSNPAFSGHFYQSLAEILSRRLRETSDLVEADGGNEGVWGDN